MVRNRDFQKLIFYYYADHYINFKDLITELYRIYKTRIWLSAINPASFSQHALGQPPSGIGPGAVSGYNQQLNTSYTMMYGADPDPYGAVPPYRIGYDTYTPNYPGIPGVANSFAPNAPEMGGGGYLTYGGNRNDGDLPSVAPGIIPSGTTADYSFYYERDDQGDQTQQSQTSRGHGAINPYSSVYSPPAQLSSSPYYSTYGGFQGTPTASGYGSQNTGSAGGAFERGGLQYGGQQTTAAFQGMPMMGGRDERAQPRGFGRGLGQTQSSVRTNTSNTSGTAAGMGRMGSFGLGSAGLSGVPSLDRVTTIPPPIGKSREDSRFPGVWDVC